MLRAQYCRQNLQMICMCNRTNKQTPQLSGRNKVLTDCRKSRTIMKKQTNSFVEETILKRTFRSNEFIAALFLFRYILSHFPIIAIKFKAKESHQILA